MLKDPLQKKELYESPDFPFVIFHVTGKQCTPPGPGYHYLHWHEDLQFTIVTKGTISMQVNGINYELHKGHGIFINSGLLHMTKQISDSGEYISFNFPAKLLSYSYGTALEMKYVLPYTSNYSFPVLTLSPASMWQNQLLQRLLALNTLWTSEHVYGKNYEIVIRLSEIWLLLIRNIKDSVGQPSHTFVRKQENLQAMLAYIHGNFMNDISLTDIASAAHISNGECCRCFKNTLHITPYEYLLTIRIAQSTDLLRETNDSVTQIAGKVGFNNGSHFIQIFKKRMKMTPHEYRKCIT